MHKARSGIALRLLPVSGLSLFFHVRDEVEISPSCPPDSAGFWALWTKFRLYRAAEAPVPGN